MDGLGLAGWAGRARPQDFRVSGNSTLGNGWEPYRVNIWIPRLEFPKKHLGCSPGPLEGLLCVFHTNRQAFQQAEHGGQEASLGTLRGAVRGERFGGFGHVSRNLLGSPSGTLWTALGLSFEASWTRTGNHHWGTIIIGFSAH